MALFLPQPIHAPLVLDEALKCLDDTELVRTHAGRPLAERLDHLWRGVSGQLEEWRTRVRMRDMSVPDSPWDPYQLRVVVEAPAYAGMYAERAARQRKAQRAGAMTAEAMQTFHMAYGAILAACWAVHTQPELVVAPRFAKEIRHEQVLRALARIGRPKPPGGADVLCALWLGATQMPEGR